MSPKIALLYVAVAHNRSTELNAARFSATYHDFPPGIDHETVIVCNGGPLRYELAMLFAVMRPQFWPRKNDPGWDVSAYIEAAHTLCAKFDFLICCGASAYFHRAGWLKRFVEAWEKHGAGFYGALSSYLLRPHLQTNGFCCSPALLRTWTKPVTSREERYEFEHGMNPLWRSASNAMLVTWDGEWAMRDWRKPANIMWRGDQSNCLIWNNHTQRYAGADPETQKRWSVNADTIR